jgi:hypothetical protein
MPGRPESYDWSNEVHREIGRALLLDSSQSLTAPEIASATGRANVKRSADEMVEAGLLERQPPPSRRSKTPGRPVTALYHLPDASAQDLRTEIARLRPVGQMERGHHIILAEAGEAQVASLFETLDASEALVSASWFALFDGEPQELAIVFAGVDALDGALDLMAELRGAELRARRTSVTGLGSIEQLATSSAKARRASRRARMARATRDTEFRSATPAQRINPT